MTVLSRLLPGLGVMVVVLLAALPWALPGEIGYVLPLLPYLAIHIFVERGQAVIPDWLVFLAGLATDVLGQGPLGYWALVYLVGFIAVRAITSERQPSAGGRIVLLALTLSALVLVQWLVTTIYRLQLTDVMPLLGAAATALVLYILIALLFPARTRELRRINDRLERGG